VARVYALVDGYGWGLEFSCVVFVQFTSLSVIVTFVVMSD